jgi:hypothetical protein
MAGRKWEARAMADASHSLSVKNTVFIKMIAYESAERHRAKSRFREAGRRPVGIADFRSQNEQYFHDLRKC